MDIDEGDDYDVSDGDGSDGDGGDTKWSSECAKAVETKRNDMGRKPHIRGITRTDIDMLVSSQFEVLLVTVD